MRMLFVEGLHQKALAWEATGVSFEKVLPYIQRIVDGRMSPHDVAKFGAAWLTLHRYGDQACDTAAIDGQIIVNSVIGWKRVDPARDINWSEVLQIVTWIHRAQREIKDLQSQDGVLSSFEPFEILSKMLPKILAAKINSFFDYDEGMALIMNQSIAITARREALAYPGAVEAGKEVAMRLLKNHVGVFIQDTFSAMRLILIKNGIGKCLSCHNSGRGTNKPKHGEDLRVQQGLRNVESLSCGCAVSSSLLELLMTKMVPKYYPDFPSRPTLDAGHKGYKAGDYAHPHSDFAFNPVLLGMTERFLVELTGMQSVDLLCQPEVRLLRIIAGASGQLIKEYRNARNENAEEQYGDEWRMITKFRESVDRFVGKMAKLQRENGLRGGSVHYDEV